MCTLGVPTIDLGVPEVSFRYTLSKSIKSDRAMGLTRYSSSVDPDYPVYGGLFEKEAIMLLRRFYIQENEKGRSKVSHDLYLLTFCQLLIPDRRRIGS